MPKLSHLSSPSSLLSPPMSLSQYQLSFLRAYCAHRSTCSPPGLLLSAGPLLVVPGALIFSLCSPWAGPSATTQVLTLLLPEPPSPLGLFRHPLQTRRVQTYRTPPESGPLCFSRRYLSSPAPTCTSQKPGTPPVIFISLSLVLFISLLSHRCHLL